MTTRFADSFYYLALLNRLDAAHQRAKAHSQSVGGDTVTTEWVLVEVADALSHAHRRMGVVRFVEALRANPNCEIVPASQGLLDRGWQLYKERPDKGWSLTDCISFVVMRDRGLTDALTADQHFDQAGFTILLR